MRSREADSAPPVGSSSRIDRVLDVRARAPMPAWPTDQFLSGINLPWHIYGCDFGANAWQPEGGLASGTRAADVRRVLEPLAATGLETVRWFVFCDGRAGVARRAGGHVGRLDDAVFRDLDAALSLLQSCRLRAVFVLIDFLWFRRARRVRGVTLGGLRGSVASSRGRDSLFEDVLAPVFRRYRGEPSIAAWDLLNEPEWATWGYGTLNPFVSVTPGVMRAFLREAARLAREEGKRPVTAGLASPRGLPLVQDAALDVWQWHWYPKAGQRRLPGAGAYAEGRPVLLGEYPTARCATPPPAIVSRARELGYAGALGWSLLGRDRFSARGAAGAPFKAQP